MQEVTIDFWFSIGTYTYLTVMRIDGIGKAEEIEFRWCPYSCRVVMTEQNNIPFTDKPVKKAYVARYRASFRR
jgi:2-hydroxychromene-2-carboxylate isomerase